MIKVSDLNGERPVSDWQLIRGSFTKWETIDGWRAYKKANGFYFIHLPNGTLYQIKRTFDQLPRPLYLSNTPIIRNQKFKVIR